MMDWIVCSNLWNCYSIHARICVKKISALLQKQRFFTEIFYRNFITKILLYHFIDPVMLVYIIPELLHKRTWIPVFHHSHVYVTTAVQILNI